MRNKERTDKRTETHACVLISQQAAIGEVKKHYRAYDNDLLELITFDIERLPPAQPEQKTATWLIRKWGDDAKCSNCGHTFKDVYDMDNHDRFCRFCGRKMVGIKGERDGD